MWKFGNLEMSIDYLLSYQPWKCGNVEMWKFGNLEMSIDYLISNTNPGSVEMWKCGNLEIWKCLLTTY